MPARVPTRTHARLLGALFLPAVLAACHQETGAQLREQAGQYRQRGEQTAALISLKNALEAEPGNAETRYQLAATYLDTGDGFSAEKEARQALAQGYAAAPVTVLLGKALLLQGEYQKALDQTGSDEAAPAPLLPVRADAWLALGQQARAQGLFERALQRNPGSAEAMIGLGRIAFMKSDATTAGAWSDKVLAAYPRLPEALMFRADLLRAQAHPERAFAVYDQVLAIHPQHRTAHVEKAYLAIGLGRYEMAEAELEAAGKTAPGSMLVAYTHALLDYSRDRPQAAQDWLLKVLRVAPEHMPSVLLAGAVSLKLGSWYIAENHFRHYLERNPDNVYARKMLASALLGSGHSQEAAEALEPALRRESGDVQLLAIAGETRMRTRDFGEAAALFEKASALDPQSSRLRTSLGLSRLQKGDTASALRELQLATSLDRGSSDAAIALIRTELSLRHFDAAMEAVRQLQRVQPKSAVAYELEGLVHVARHENKEARAAFSRALGCDPSHFPASADLAQLAIDEHQPQEARRHIEAFLAVNKDSVSAMTALAALAGHDGKQDEATRWLEQAAAVDPNAVGPAVNLIAQYLRTNQPEKSLSLARKVQVNHPDDPDLLDLLGKSQLANGETAEALDAYRKLSFALPRSSQALMQVAALQRLMNNPKDAEEALKGVLAIQPDFPSAQLELAELYVRKGSHDLALMVAERLQRHHPQAAAGYQLQADILMAKRQPAQALPFYERAFALSGSNELAIKMDNALRLAGRRDEAVKRLDRWLASHPDDVRVQAYKAQTWMAEREFKSAAAQLEAVLKRQPNNAVALNNLALAYQELGDARAQATAEAALAQAPNQPDVMDTLGWILAGKGDAARAVTVLQKARELAPKARDIRYHLAAALARAGDRAGARKELEALVAGDMRFAQADEARELLTQLR